MKLLTLPGVFSPISDSWMLADAIPQERLGSDSRALDICTGSGVLDALCDGAPAHLRPGGVLLLVHSSLIGTDATLERLRAAGLVDVEVRLHARGPLGPLMRAQQAAGRIPSAIDEEGVVVIRASSPAAP
jgi:tRNA1(Val) A37 N6-methylase TrmN6